MNNLITVIIPTYNRANLISATLDSVLAQTYAKWECIIVDDFSTDDTQAVVEKYINKDSRFKFLVNQRKKGAQGARNTGLIHASGDWINFLDSDNTIDSNKFQKQLERIFQDKIDICSCFSFLINDSDQITGKFEWVVEGYILKELLTREMYVDYNASMIKKKNLLDVGLLDEDCPSYQEWDTHIRLAETANFGTVREPLVNYYQRVQGRISNDLQREYEGLIYVLKKHKELYIKECGEEDFLREMQNLIPFFLKCNFSLNNEEVKKFYEVNFSLKSKIILGTKKLLKWLKRLSIKTYV